MTHVILVDNNDNEIGTMEKMEAHRTGALHRAFSVLLFNSKGDFLIQKRAPEKYHSAGLWTNTCCSHPQPKEHIEDAVRKTLHREMGIDLRPEFAYKFVYEAHLDSNLTEHEYDHVFTGIFDGRPVINGDEVEDWKFISRDELESDIAAHPELYSAWFRLIVSHPELKQTFQKAI